MCFQNALNLCARKTPKKKVLFFFLRLWFNNINVFSISSAQFPYSYANTCRICELLCKEDTVVVYLILLNEIFQPIFLVFFSPFPYHLFPIIAGRISLQEKKIYIEARSKELSPLEFPGKNKCQTDVFKRKQLVLIF